MRLTCQGCRMRASTLEHVGPSCVVPHRGEGAGDQGKHPIQQRSQGKRPPDLPQTLAPSLHVWHRFRHQPPEVRRVVLMGEVGHLVDDYVFHERRLQHHGSPVEPQRTVGGAASPPKGDDVMPIAILQIVEQSTDLLHYYGVIPVSFTVNSQYRVSTQLTRG